jgi:2',3'-cyclic-nucleotide 2'-phosphodiesterase (5'-nucleotidase family)
MMIRQLIVVFVFLIFLPLAVEGRDTTLNILYTGAMNGELEPCGCSPKTDFGGLERISGYILRNRTGLYPYILIDAGNFSDRDSEQGRLKAEAIVHSFNIMKYDAVAFMENEKSFSDDFSAALIQRYDVPFVSDSYPCKRSVSISRGRFEVNISSGLDEHEGDKLNILVTDKSVAELKTAEGWDVIISSSGEIMDEAMKVNGSIFVSGYPKGKSLGILTLDVDEQGKVTNFKHRFAVLGTDIQEDEMVRKVLDDYDSKVAALMKDAERPPAGTTYLGVSKCGDCKVIP